MNFLNPRRHGDDGKRRFKYWLTSAREFSIAVPAVQIGDKSNSQRPTTHYPAAIGAADDSPEVTVRAGHAIEHFSASDRLDLGGLWRHFKIALDFFGESGADSAYPLVRDILSRPTASPGAT